MRAVLCCDATRMSSCPIAVEEPPDLSAQVAQSKSADMLAAKEQPLPPSSLQVNDTGGPTRETTSVGPNSQSGANKNRNSTNRRGSIVSPGEIERYVTIMPELVAFAKLHRGPVDANSPSSSSSSPKKATPTTSMRQAKNEQANNSVVAIEMDGVQQENQKSEDNKPPLPVRTPRKRSGLFFNPSDSFCYWWSAIVSLAFLYNFWSLSYRFAFREIDSSTCLIWFAFDYTADLIYALDIFVMSKTGYLEDGVLQRDTSKIKNHYLESTLFYLDSACLLPFDILYLSFGYNSIFRFNRLFKIYKFWSFVDRTERHTNYPNVFRTFTLVHYILVIFHWNACIFHMISNSPLVDVKTLFKIPEQKCEDIFCEYLHAFYWSTLALTIIGGLPHPRVKSEYIFVIVELFFGLFLFASVLGHVANIVTNVSAARKEFQARLDAVKTFMRTRRVSDDLQRKVIRWFDYLWISQKSSDEERSVACLPDRLKAEIAIHVNLDTLKRVDIFQETEAGFLRELVLRLKPVLFSPGDYVCRKDEAGHEMYIVSRGILEVVTNEGQLVVATFRAGSYFGEIAVLNVGSAGNKRTASVRSVGYSDLFCLSKQDLWDVLKDYPNAEARIRAVAEERLSALGDRAESENNSWRARGRHSLRRAAAALLTRTRHAQQQQHQQFRHASKLDDELVRSNESLNVGDDEPGPSGGGGGGVCGPDRRPINQRRRVCSLASHHQRAMLRRTTATGQSHRRVGPCSPTMEPICDDHALFAPQPRPPRQAAATTTSAYGLGVAAGAGGGCCCECQQTTVRQHQYEELVATTRCFCQYCQPSSASVELTALPAASVPARSPVPPAAGARPSPTDRSPLATTTCAINQDFAVGTTSSSSSAGGPSEVGRSNPPSGGESVMGGCRNRHQLSLASARDCRQGAPGSLHIGQSRSFDFAGPAGRAPDERPATADRSRSGRRLAARFGAPNAAPNDATTTTTTTTTTTKTSSTPESTNPTTGFFACKHLPYLGCISASGTASMDVPGPRAQQGASASTNLSHSGTSHLRPDYSANTGDLRRCSSLRGHRGGGCPSPVLTSTNGAFSDYHLEYDSQAADPDGELADEAARVPPPASGQQLDSATRQKRPVQKQQQVFGGSRGPTEATRASSFPAQSARLDQSEFPAINPPTKSPLAIETEGPEQATADDDGHGSQPKQQ